MKKYLYFILAFQLLFACEALADDNELTFDGKLSAQIVRDIGIPFPIYVEKVFVTTGDEVRKGERLLEYSIEDKDLRPLQQEIYSAGGQADLDIQLAGLKQEQAYAKNKRALDAELSAKGLISPQEVAKNANNARLIKSKLDAFYEKNRIVRDAFEKRLKELETYFGFPVKAGQKLPEKFYLTSNMTGTIIGMSAAARPEGYLSGNLFTVAKLNPIQAQIEVHESEIINMHEGQKVTVTLANDNGKVYEGKIVMLSLRPNDGSIAVPSYYRVMVDVENPDNFLKPGYKVLVHLPRPKKG